MSMNSIQRTLALAAVLGGAGHASGTELSPPPSAEPTVFAQGVRARFNHGKLRPAQLIFTDEAVTVEQEPDCSLRFDYDRDLHVRRGRYYLGVPLFGDEWFYYTVVLNLPWIAIEAASNGLGSAAAILARSAVGTSAPTLIRLLLNRQENHWLELSSHVPQYSAVYVRLPRKKERRMAIFKEFRRRDPKELLVRPPPRPDWKPPVAEGDEAPDFALEDLNGSTWRLSDLRGKVVLLNFWATWCGPCRVETPHLEALHRRHAESGLVVLGINDEPSATVRAFLREQQVTFANLQDAAGKAFRLYGINALPTSVLIGRDGRIRAILRGFRGKKALNRAVARALLDAKPVPQRRNPETTRF